jgi:hypothetical protein
LVGVAGKFSVQLCCRVHIVFIGAVDNSDPVGAEEAELASIAIEESVSGETVVLLGSVKKFRSGEIPWAFEDRKFGVAEQSTGFSCQQ